MSKRIRVKGFDDPRKKIDGTISKREQKPGMGFKSKGVQRVYDNLNFGKHVQENPVTTDKYDVNVFGVETIDMNHYLSMRIWPRSIYTTDKLMRLIASARLEFLKRYIAKKNKLEFNYLWLIILLIGIPAALLLLLYLLPRLMGGL